MFVCSAPFKRTTNGVTSHTQRNNFRDMSQVLRNRETTDTNITDNWKLGRRGEPEKYNPAKRGAEKIAKIEESHLPEKHQ